MPRLSVVLATAFAAIALAVVAVNIEFGSDAPEVSPPRRTETGRTPAFHLRLDGPARRRAARKCLDRITSAQAKALGAVKDDLALLADDPQVIRLILEDWEQRARISKFESAAFGDLFARIRHPDFVAPGVTLLEHQEFQVRHKAIEVAATQRDPRFVPGLDRLFAEITERSPGEGMRTLDRIVSAARSCGGDHLPVLLARALRNPLPHVRDVAAAIIREDRMEGMRDRIASLLDDEEPQARLQAAWGLATFGDDRAVSQIIDGLNPRNPTLSSFCMEAARDLGLRDAIPTLKHHIPAASAELKSGMWLTLGVMGDPEAQERLRDWANDPEARVPDRIVGLMALAAMGKAKDLPLLRKIIRDGTAIEVQNIAVGLTFKTGAPDLELARGILSCGHFAHPGPAQVAEWLPRLGDRLVPWLAQRLDDGGDPVFLIASLDLSGTALARDEILRRRESHPRLVEERIRLMDLALRQEGPQ